MSEALKVQDRLGDYILEAPLGRGLSASTWLARKAGEAGAACEAGDACEAGAVLKVLDFGASVSWTAVDIFRREAQALERLSFPGIPRYLGYFESGSEGALRLVLAMEYMDGRNLESIVAAGARYPESEVSRILAELSDILAYLGSLRPPIVHRDVNPRNVILRPDGRVALVDFSGVQDAVRTALHPGATLVGTAGYIPLEQVAGRASHRSDLYGAAATAVFLLTGRNPAELPLQGLRIDLDGIVDPEPALRAVMENWLDPDANGRTMSAADAGLLLRGEKPLALAADAQRKAPVRATADTGRDSVSAAMRLPADSRVVIAREGDGLTITIPPLGLRSNTMPGLWFTAVWIGFISFWTFMSIRMRAPIFFPLFSLPFWAVGAALARSTIRPAFARQSLRIDRDRITLSTSLLGTASEQSYPLADVGGVKIEPTKIQVHNSGQKEISIETGTRAMRIGHGLSERELLYLKSLIDGELSRQAS